MLNWFVNMKELYCSFKHFCCHDFHVSGTKQGVRWLSYFSTLIIVGKHFQDDARKAHWNWKVGRPREIAFRIATPSWTKQNSLKQH